MQGRARRATVVGLEVTLVVALLVTALATWVYVRSEQQLTRDYSRATPPIEVDSSPATVARGRHLAEHVGLCTWCHGEDLSGKTTADDPWVGRLHASNLTRGDGGIADYSNGDLARAIRQGIRPDGRSLLLMPSQYLKALTDEDLAAILAWLKTVPPVDAVRAETKAGPLTRIALVSGLAPELIAAEPLASRAGGADPHAAPQREGAYLVDIAACRVCHHDDLSGGLHPLALPDEPPPPDLTPSGPLSSWSFADFERAMRTGITPDGRTLSPEYMPWPHYAGMTDEELRAIWGYLEAAPSEGSRR